LGLSISKSIVDAHAGRIWAESNRGGGTTFHVDVPAASESKLDQPLH
jgi:two-component system sensor kinase FixL